MLAVVVAVLTVVQILLLVGLGAEALRPYLLELLIQAAAVAVAALADQALLFFATPVLYNTLLVAQLLARVIMSFIRLHLLVRWLLLRQLHWLICLLIRLFSIRLIHGLHLLALLKLNILWLLVAEVVVQDTVAQVALVGSELLQVYL
jgi:hypothetical protein